MIPLVYKDHSLVQYCKSVYSFLLPGAAVCLFQVPFGVTVNGSTLFVSDWTLAGIYAYDMKTGFGQQLLAGIEEPMALLFTKVSSELTGRPIVIRHSRVRIV